MNRTLCDELAQALDEVRRSSFDSSPELEARLRASIDNARAAWPEIHLNDNKILAHLARALERGSMSSVGEWLAADTMGDLYLACACAAGDPIALAAFESRYMPLIDKALRRLTIEDEVINEVKQTVRVTLLTGDGTRPPRIADFTGAGNLNGWLRVVAINAARRILRGHGRETPLEEVSFEALGTASRELDFLKANYREQFNLAFAAAISQLTPRDRTLLRQHYMLGLSIDQLGTIYRVHRATCARWLTKCRETLYAQTRAALVLSLKIDRAEFENVMQLIESKFDVSVRRYLEEEA